MLIFRISSLPLVTQHTASCLVYIFECPSPMLLTHCCSGSHHYCHYGHAKTHSQCGFTNHCQKLMIRNYFKRTWCSLPYGGWVVELCAYLMVGTLTHVAGSTWRSKPNGIVLASLCSRCCTYIKAHRDRPAEPGPGLEFGYWAGIIGRPMAPGCTQTMKIILYPCEYWYSLCRHSTVFHE